MSNAQRDITVSIDTSGSTPSALYTYVTQDGRQISNSPTCDTTCQVPTDFHFVLDAAAQAAKWTFIGITPAPSNPQALTGRVNADGSLDVTDACTIAGSCSYTIDCMNNGTLYPFDPETQNDPDD